MTAIFDVDAHTIPATYGQVREGHSQQGAEVPWFPHSANVPFRHYCGKAGAEITLWQHVINKEMFNALVLLWQFIHHVPWNSSMLQDIKRYSTNKVFSANKLMPWLSKKDILLSIISQHSLTMAAFLRFHRTLMLCGSVWKHLFYCASSFPIVQNLLRC